MASRTKFENSNEIGCFVKLTNSFCLVADGASEDLYEAFRTELDGVPIVPMSIAGTKMVGRMTAGNSTGLLVPATTTDEELEVLTNSLPDIKIRKLEEKLSALGNCIACNDRVALIHPEMDEDTEAAIAEVLNVEVYR